MNKPRKELSKGCHTKTAIGRKENPKGFSKVSSQKSTRNRDGTKYSPPFQGHESPDIEKKFSKQQWKLLHIIHESFARIFAVYLSTRFLKDITATLLRIEQKTFEDYLTSIPRSSHFSGFTSPHLGGKAFMAVTSNVLHSLLAKENEPIPFEIPKTERGIMEEIPNHVCSILRASWMNVIDLCPSIERIEDAAHISRILPPGELILASSIEIEIHDVHGILELCIPSGFPEHVADRLNDPLVTELWKDPGKKLTRRQLNDILYIQEDFARLLAGFFSEWSKTEIEASIISLDQLSFEEFLRSVPRPCFIASLKLETLDNKALIAIDLEVLFPLLDRYHGGYGAIPEIIRPLSEQETVSMTKAMPRILAILRESWLRITDISPTLECFESNPRFASIVPPYYKVLVIDIQIMVHAVIGTMHLCIPLSALNFLNSSQK